MKTDFWKRHYGTFRWLILVLVFLDISISTFGFVTWRTEISTPLLILDLLTSCLLAWDIYLTINGRGFQRVESIKMDIQAVQINYSRSLFLKFELIAALPFHLLIVVFDLDGFWHLLPILRGLRLLRFYYDRKNIALTSLSSNLVLVGMAGALIVHFMACGWMYIYPDRTVDTVTFYNKAVYWTITTLTTIGYGDITPTTNGGRVFTMIVMITGAGIYSFLIGNVSRLVLAADKHRDAIKEKVADLSSFMDYYQIPTSTRSQVFEFMGRLSQQRLSDNDQRIIGDLPMVLQSDLKIYMSIKLIREIPLFANCSIECLRLVSEKLKQACFAPGQTVVSAGEEGHEMFLVGHGMLEVLSEQSKPIATISDGQFFGEMALLGDSSRVATVRAKSYCDAYILEKEDFLAILSEFEDVQRNVESIVAKRQKTLDQH